MHSPPPAPAPETPSPGARPHCILATETGTRRAVPGRGVPAHRLHPRSSRRGSTTILFACSASSTTTARSPASSRCSSRSPPSPSRRIPSPSACAWPTSSHLPCAPGWSRPPSLRLDRLRRDREHLLQAGSSPGAGWWCSASLPDPWPGLRQRAQGAAELPKGNFFAALISFNIGVELGPAHDRHRGRRGPHRVVLEEALVPRGDHHPRQHHHRRGGPVLGRPAGPGLRLSRRCRAARDGRSANPPRSPATHRR